MRAPLLGLALGAALAAQGPIQISGIYPHLAVCNSDSECGIGAVVPWAGKLWYLTYPPHQPNGSPDKLWELDAALNAVARPESVGGTHACRMLHAESSQLVIGPYFVDAQGTVRAVSPARMPGRLTAVARHLSLAGQLVYFYGMEGEHYEVDVQTLAVRRLSGKVPIPGDHGKGGYTSQGKLVVSNNGAGGGLGAYDGVSWSTVRSAQFTEVTGPGGIAGAPSPSSVLWAVGFDHRSVLLDVLDGGAWSTFRLPKASYTHDGANGWYTEWPRIREVATGRPVLDMHGMLYDLPPGFRPGVTAGIAPLSSHLKMLVDWCDWSGQLVFACNDTSRFSNPIAGQAQSNLWFTSAGALAALGPPRGSGGPWVGDSVAANVPSDPYLVHGFAQRVVHLKHGASGSVTFTLELDLQGDGAWTTWAAVVVPPGEYRWQAIPASLPALWLRARTDRAAPAATVWVTAATPAQGTLPDPMFQSLADIDSPAPRVDGLVRPRGANLKSLHFLAETTDAHGQRSPAGYHEILQDMQLRSVEDPSAAAWLRANAAITQDFTVDAASAIVVDASGQRWRLPRTHPAYEQPWATGWPRGFREVVTERSLLQCCGTFYEVPRDANGGVRGVARMQPVCTHGKRILDFCSWSGLLVLSGTRVGATPDGHYFATDRGLAGLWFGNVDDLWKLGKPRGHGGPWNGTAVPADVPSDPYLMAGYDRKRLVLAHDQATPVAFTIEVDVAADGAWTTYGVVRVDPGTPAEHVFPNGYAAHWVRLRASVACTATATLHYE